MYQNYIAVFLAGPNFSLMQDNRSLTTAFNNSWEKFFEFARQ